MFFTQLLMGARRGWELVQHVARQCALAVAFYIMFVVNGREVDQEQRMFHRLTLLYLKREVSLHKDKDEEETVPTALTYEEIKAQFRDRAWTLPSKSKDFKNVIKANDDFKYLNTPAKYILKPGARRRIFEKEMSKPWYGDWTNVVIAIIEIAFEILQMVQMLKLNVVFTLPLAAMRAVATMYCLKPYDTWQTKLMKFVIILAASTAITFMGRWVCGLVNVALPQKLFCPGVDYTQAGACESSPTLDNFNESIIMTALHSRS